MITVERLIAMGIGPTAAKLHAPHLQAACERFEIVTFARQTDFVAQAAHETAGLTAFEENLYYRDPVRVARLFRTAFDLNRDRAISASEIADAARYVRKPQALANRIYADRYGNGPEASGDGWRYRGRGGGHLTFKGNYHDAGQALARPYVDQPELVAQPADAALTFAWYWHTRKCNLLADAGKFDAITQVINPGMAGVADRRAWRAKAREAFR